MRNDELKHYGVKGMKWRQHKYKTRDGNDGDYGYDYGNNNGKENSNWSNLIYKTASNSRTAAYNSNKKQREIMNTGHNKYFHTRAYKRRMEDKEPFKIAGKHLTINTRLPVHNAASDARRAADNAKKYKVVNMYGDEPVKPRSKKLNQRVTQDRTGDRKLSAVEIAANKARNADNYTAKKNRQTRQKAKNSAEVRAKTLGEALGKVGRSASANNPMARQKTKARLNKSVQDTAGKITSSAKRSASSKRKKDEQRKLNNERLKKVMNKMQANVEKHNAAVRRRRQIENAKKWVNSKLNDAGKFVNDRKKDASNFINSLGKTKKKKPRVENSEIKGVKKLTKSELKRLRKQNKKKK